MPTECERSAAPNAAMDTPQTAAHTEPKTDASSSDKQRAEEAATTSNGHSDANTSSGRKSSITSPDPTAYVAKARITRPTPPPPSYNPMQFVQIKPCNLYQTAQQQLKKAEEVKKIKEIKKEEPEDWQNNLDNWKSSRRKRVEHIIDRVVEVKKLELEEFDRSRRKSKTFSEMIEERGERGARVGRAKLASLAVYNEDEANDLSDLGIGTSSASGKSSLSEDYDNNSVTSDNADLEKAIFDNNHHQSSLTTREYVSSPGYDTSSSTAPASSPDPCEYTYEGAIQDYKQRVSRASSGSAAALHLSSSKVEIRYTAKEAAAERDSSTFDGYPPRRGSKIEERLIGFEVSSPNDSQELCEKSKVDLPKINISKRKEIFENVAIKSSSSSNGSPEQKSNSNGVPKVTLRDHFKVDGAAPRGAQPAEGRRFSGDITSIKERLLSLEQQQNPSKATNDSAKASSTAKTTVDVPVLPLKDRLSSLQSAATKEEVRKPPVLLVDARQLEIMKDEEEHAKQRMQRTDFVTLPTPADQLLVDRREADVDRDDSGIQTCDDVDELEERSNVKAPPNDSQEQQLNEAIAALAIEEQQLQAAANAVNRIEAEFAQLADTTNMTPGDEPPSEMDLSINEALELALEAIDRETATNLTTTTTQTTNNKHFARNSMETQFINHRDEAEGGDGGGEMLCDVAQQQELQTTNQGIRNEPIYENISKAAALQGDTAAKIIPNCNKINSNSSHFNVKPMNGLPAVSQSSVHPAAAGEEEPYYQVPKSSEPYYDAPKHPRPVPVYENIEIFYSGLENGSLEAGHGAAGLSLEPPKEKPPPPPTDSPPEFEDGDSVDNGDLWSSDNTYQTITKRLSKGLAAAVVGDPHPSPPIKRLNSTKRIKKELRHKRSSFLGIESSADDELESFLDLTVAPPPDMAQLLQEERRLEKQLYMKAGLCDSSDTGESRDSGVSENHSRQSSEPFTNSSEEADRTDELPLSLITDTIMKPKEVIYQNEAQLLAAQTPLLQTVKGNSAESWTESATEAAAATKSLSEATATANAKMLSIEEKIREQEEVLRVERELLHLEQEELKRQRENLMLRENIARRELQHGAKMLMSANRRSLQDLNAAGVPSSAAFQAPSMAATVQVPPQQQKQPLHAQQQIYANVPNLQQQYYLVDASYRKSMSDLNEFSKRLAFQTTPMPPTKPMRATQMAITNGHSDYNQLRRSPPTKNSVGGSLNKSTAFGATPATGQRQTPLALYPNQQLRLAQPQAAAPNMTRNTLHALSATPKPKYTDGWVQVQNRKSFDANLSNDPSWLTSYQQKRKSVPEAYMFSSSNTSARLMQEQEQRRLAEQNRLVVNQVHTPVHQQNGSSSALKINSNPPSTSSSNNNNNKPLPDSIIQTLTERLQSKGIGERRRFENYSEKSSLQATNSYQQQGYQVKQQPQLVPPSQTAAAQRQTLEPFITNQITAPSGASTSTAAHDKVLSVSGKKKCSHCGDELGRGAAMIIESLLLFYHINCFKCCVCHVQLGDGLNGTDVRVRNHKLHCQNCYSSDDGIKFSCV